MSHDFTFIDLFAGCGGMAYGFASEGFVPVGAVEVDHNAAETYALNVDRRIWTRDIAGVQTWPTAQVVIGGPPCQGFSQLGTRDPSDPRNRLWREYIRALRISGAEVFVMENVPHLLNSHHYNDFAGEVRRMGYRVTEAVLNAADYGVPQKRRRAFIVGSRCGVPDMPTPTHGARPELLPHRTVRQAWAEPEQLPGIPDEVNWHRSRKRLATFSLARYQAVPKNGGNRFEMQHNLDRTGRSDMVPPCWRSKPKGTTDVFGRMWWDRPAPTIRTEFFKPEKGRYLHPAEHRPITVREAARLQSFPDSFSFPADQSMTAVARQVGNAVPPVLAAAIAREVRAHLIGLSAAAV